jgi:hypothetical protein
MFALQEILSSRNFNKHKCEKSSIGVKTIPVIDFLQTSRNGKEVMTGWGVNGILYTFEVMPRKPIPFIKGSSDDSYHDNDNPTESCQNPPAFRARCSVKWSEQKLIDA